DGRFTIAFTPNAAYQITTELTGFTRAERDLTLGAPPCDTTIDFTLSLRPRGDSASRTEPGAARTGRGAAGAGAASTTARPAEPTASGDAAAQGPRTQGQAARFGRGQGPGAGAGGRGGPRFQTLDVQSDAAGTAALEASAPDDGGDVARLLPPGFS